MKAKSNRFIIDEVRGQEDVGWDLHGTAEREGEGKNKDLCDWIERDRTIISDGIDLWVKLRRRLWDLSLRDGAVEWWWRKEVLYLLLRHLSQALLLILSFSKHIEKKLREKDMVLVTRKKMGTLWICMGEMEK